MNRRRPQQKTLSTLIQQLNAVENPNTALTNTPPLNQFDNSFRDHFNNSLENTSTTLSKNSLENTDSNNAEHEGESTMRKHLERLNEKYRAKHLNQHQRGECRICDHVFRLTGIDLTQLLEERSSSTDNDNTEK